MRDEPLRVLQVAPAFFPATYWGGPTVSVFHLCNGLAREPGVNLKVLTTDTSGPRGVDRLTENEKRPEQYSGYPVYFCRKLAGVDFTPAVWRHVWRHVAWADVVHLNSVYTSTTLPTLVAARFLRKPLVWSPRGALQRWSGSRKPWLKGVWNLSCRMLLRREWTRIHGTSDEEAVESSDRLAGMRSFVVPNGVEAPGDCPQRDWRAGGILRILFLGRLDPKKGIENLLRALPLLEPGTATLEICGGGDPAYEATLRRVASGLGVFDRVRFRGHVEGDQKASAYRSADVCVVPSYTENFAMVVAESLVHGTPVIASTGTPWRELQEKGAGWWVPNDPASLSAALDLARGADLASMGQKGRNWMIAKFSWQSVARRMLAQYQELAS